MKSQLLSVVILVTLGHSYAVLQRPPACKRTDDGAVDISELDGLRQKAISTKRVAHSRYFDEILVVVARYLFNLGPVAFDKTSEDTLKKGIQGDQRGTDYILEAIPVALRKHCDGIKTAKKQIHACVSHAFSEAFAGAKLAVGKYYMKNRAAIEVAQSKTRTNAVKLFQFIYDVIRTNLKYKDADTLNAIQSAENRSIISILNDVDGAFDVGKLLGLAIAYGNKNVSLINDVEECRDKSVTGVRYSIYHIHGLLEALYIKSCLDNTAGILSALSIIRYSRIMRSHNISQLVTLGFGVVIGLVKNIAFNVSINTEILYSQLDIVLGKLVAILVAEGEYFFETVLAVSPEDSCKVEVARKQLRIEINAAVGSFENIINVSPIQMNATEMADVITYRGVRYVNILIGLVPTSKYWSDKLKAEFALATKKALSSAADYLQRARDAINIFAKFVSSNKTYYADAIAAISIVQNAGLLSTLAYVEATINLLQISLFAGHQTRIEFTYR